MPLSAAPSTTLLLWDSFIISAAEVYVPRSKKITTAEQAIIPRIAAMELKNRDVKRMNFNVIQYAKSQGVSAALLEMCFIDDADDMAYHECHRRGLSANVIGCKR